MNTTRKQLNSSSKLIIGLTGGIGSGKTIVSDWFATQGITIVDADVIAHQTVALGSKTLNDIENAFGKSILTATGELNRKALRERVFQNSADLKTLEKITHPAIRQQIIQELGCANTAYTILSAPLLLEGKEAGLAQLCHYIMVVDVSEEVQIERAMGRDGQSIEQIQSIMKKQLSRTDRKKSADIMIKNSGTLGELYKILPSVHEKLLNLAKDKPNQ